MSAYAQSKPADVPRTPWWLVLIEGIAVILLGMLLFASPVSTTAFLVQFLGIYWLVKGLFNIVSIFIDRAMWGWKLFSGIVGIIAGLLVLQHPIWSTLIVPSVLVYIVAFSGLFLGLMGLIQAFRGAGWGAGVLGVVSIIFALILLFNPFMATLAVPWVLGLLGIVGGIMAIFGSFGLRRLQKESAMQAQAAATPAMQTRAGVFAPAPVTPPLPVEPLAALQAEPAVGVGGGAVGAVAAAVVVDSATQEPETSFSVASETPQAEPEAAQAATVALQAEPPAGISGGKFEEDIEYVEGIGPAFGQKLKAISIFTPKDLLERGAAPKGREEIAESTGISSKLVLEWVNHCDLFRIKGVGSEYADLLEAAGVDTVVELATRNPANLYLRILDVNAEKNLVRRVPVLSQVEDWVAQAKLLPRVITY